MSRRTATPLAGLRSTIDVTLARTRQPVDYQEGAGDCQRIAAQLQRLVENLFSLARLESGDDVFRFDFVSLNQLVGDQWKEFSQVADARKLDVEWSLAPDRMDRLTNCTCAGRA